MDKVTLENYRCFHEEQVARLAPLTLLVGDNSTGKTSFLAMVRALIDIAGSRYPDFKEEPYDLGSFDEIAHHRGGKGGKAKTFKAGFSTTRLKSNRGKNKKPRNFNVTFGKRGASPIVVKRNFAFGNCWADESFDSDRSYVLQFGTSRGSWRKKVPIEFVEKMGLDIEYDLKLPIQLLFDVSFAGEDEEFNSGFETLSNSPAITSEDRIEIRRLLFFNHRIFFNQRPFASAPVRSKPSRTYDPSRVTPDPEGDYIPMYLANMYFQNKSKWNKLKSQLEKFGRTAGLFDEISIGPLRPKKDGGAFQVEIRKFGNRLKGPKRNIIDVGYGVSQILPVITELLRPGAPSMFLLQQPEVHLHPSAQAALGTLFCQVADWNRQLVVETHSDHLIDRVRMEVRDDDLSIKPEEVSILYFEREELGVRIYSLGLDKEGNVLNAPSTYRRFFMEETQRSLRL